MRPSSFAFTVSPFTESFGDQPFNQGDGDDVTPESIALGDQEHVTSRQRDSFEQHGPIFDPELPRRATVHEHAHHLKPKAGGTGSNRCLLRFESKPRIRLLIGRDAKVANRARNRCCSHD